MDAFAAEPCASLRLGAFGSTIGAVPLRHDLLGALVSWSSRWAQVDGLISRDK